MLRRWFRRPPPEPARDTPPVPPAEADRETMPEVPDTPGPVDAADAARPVDVELASDQGALSTSDGTSATTLRQRAEAREGFVRAMLASDAVSPATRAVMTARLDALHEPPITVGAALTEAEVTTLRAALDRLIPQDDRALPVDLVCGIDERLAAGIGDGWRYDVLPSDAEALRRGIAGLDEAAQAAGNPTFVASPIAAQNEILRHVQGGFAAGQTWRSLRGDRWFEELLAAATVLYYADPLSLDEIGFVGYADLPSWQHLGLNERDVREQTPDDVAARWPVRSAGHDDPSEDAPVPTADDEEDVYG